MIYLEKKGDMAVEYIEKLMREKWEAGCDAGTLESLIAKHGHDGLLPIGLTRNAPARQYSGGLRPGYIIRGKAGKLFPARGNPHRLEVYDSAVCKILALHIPNINLTPNEQAVFMALMWKGK